MSARHARSEPIRPRSARLSAASAPSLKSNRNRPDATNVPDRERSRRPEIGAMDYDFFFGFDGRINRAKYWRVMLLNFICLMIFMLVVPLSIGTTFYDGDPTWAKPLTLALLAGTMGPAFIISTWCFAAMSIKRLHDRNKSGWWMVLFFVVPSLLDK